MEPQREQQSNPISNSRADHTVPLQTPRLRTRTTFTEAQIARMGFFAWCIGWRLPKGKERAEEVSVFCREIGVTRSAFRVWMMNHKRDYVGRQLN